MPKTKKFIDKKNAETFVLVHRSQKDPLAADDTAPQRVLVPLSSNGSKNDSTPSNQSVHSCRNVKISFNQLHQRFTKLIQIMLLLCSLLTKRNGSRHRLNLEFILMMTMIIRNTCAMSNRPWNGN